VDEASRLDELDRFDARDELAEERLDLEFRKVRTKAVVRAEAERETAVGVGAANVTGSSMNGDAMRGRTMSSTTRR
jgi:hypothetical protein